MFCAVTNRPEAATIHNNISITLIYKKKKTEGNRKKLNKEKNKVANQSPQSVDLFWPLTNRPKAATINNKIPVALTYKKKIK